MFTKKTGIIDDMYKGHHHNGPTDEDVNEKAMELYKLPFNSLSSIEQDEIYKVLGVKEEKEPEAAKVDVKEEEIEKVEAKKEPANTHCSICKAPVDKCKCKEITDYDPKAGERADKEAAKINNKKSWLADKIDKIAQELGQ